MIARPYKHRIYIYSLKRFNLIISTLAVVLLQFFSANTLALDDDAKTLNQESLQFGRVFTTQEQRVELNKLRADGLLEGAESQVEVKASVERNERNQMRFSGFVLSEDGENTVWIDGKSKLTQSDSTSEAKVSRPSSVSQSAKIVAENKSTIIKPGQVWLLNSDEVKEGYEIKPEARERKESPKTEEQTNVDAAIETLQTLEKLKSQ